MPAKKDQIAALPMKIDKSGDVRVLMVTSRDTGRWIMPKGWVMDGKKPWKAAAIEALEEAGAKGEMGRQMLGVYHYKKRLAKGKSVRCRVEVYPMIVEKLLSNWKERVERKRKWFSPKSAARKVSEPELAKLIRDLPKKPKKINGLVSGK